MLLMQRLTIISQIINMPSRRVEEFLSSLTEQEYHASRARFERTEARAAIMSYEEFLEQLELQNQWEGASRRDEARNNRADYAANGFGGFDYLGSWIPCSRKARDRHASGSSHGHGDRRGIGRRDYEARYGDESLAGESDGFHAEGGSGNLGARTQSGAFNTYGPAHRHTGYSTEDIADFGGRDYRHRASPPPRRGGMPLGERSAAQPSLADASSRHNGGRQDLPSQDRDDSYDSDASFASSSRRYDGRHNPAGRRH
ncbi:hypothetical protein HO173_007547 [Letharia columbiana]|uniref:Uncharacterized protein n=1 Tax=Letharia columbiana TaxID=112416 RepID=A0A8H6FSX5_9LECA|nr:uncharacterized protein HO173_007547 [Letharia columbiana]KAF6234128.1 hypothetical protein HO173_007547 [Letharia columbiana]